MDLRIFFLLTASVVSGQYYPQNIINTTQQLQDIEKYGPNYAGGSSNLYPMLSNLTDNVGHRSNYSQSSNVTIGGRASPGLFNQTSDSSRESFRNRTMSNMPKGICTKEVP